MIYSFGHFQASAELVSVKKEIYVVYIRKVQSIQNTFSLSFQLEIHFRAIFLTN